MDRVPGLFSDLRADVLPQPQDVSGSSHPHQTSVIGHPIKGGVDFYPAFAE